MTVIDRFIHKRLSIAPLVTFRVVFGFIMFLSIVRFWANGWIEEQFIKPAFHFKYFGFHWMPEFADWGYYLMFSLMAFSALGIALGAFYRISAIVFFLSFTTIELVDATYYLNHYYFVSLVAFLLIWLPANRRHSVDVKMGLTNAADHVPALAINLIKFQLGLVYFLAGVAKLNADWLFEAMPLAIWLPSQDHLPVIGSILKQPETAFAFSWAGAIYDLSIPFLLLIARTRWLAYIAVVVFHLLTWSLFQIGMFPFIMIGATLIFFSADLHQKAHGFLGGNGGAKLPTEPAYFKISMPVKAVVAVFAVVQLALPFRHLLYPGNPFWHEQGYRFGWRVMLVEKAGYAQFKVVDEKGRKIFVDNRDFLTPVQEKMMSTQADFMLQYAKFLKQHYSSEGVETAAVNADVFVTFNGRSSCPFIDPSVDLASIEDGWRHKTWILPFNPGKS
ncbi:MAG: HTTM domain-containing protein [Salibacteraceae bacterium]